jgi:iron complex outermembrane receptor protein
VDATRGATGAYADLEWRLLPAWTAGAALRHDRYEDFGAATSWKMSSRLALSPQWALRASANTGFRAPSLQQQFFSSVTSASSNGRLVNVGTYQVRDPVARALGASNLRPETSRHASLGAVWSAAPGLWLTADAWRVSVRDRIVLSDQLGGAAVLAVLAAAGIADVQQAQFFTNVADTSTRGIDATVQLAQRLGEVQLNVSSSYSRFHTHLDRLAPNPVLPALALLGNRALLLLTEGQPRDKWLSSVRWTQGEWQLQASATRYGRYTGQPVTSTQTFGAKWLTDLSLRWRFLPN